MIRSEALITSSAIDTAMMAMTCIGTCPPPADARMGVGSEPEGLSSAPAGSLAAVSVINLGREGVVENSEKWGRLFGFRRKHFFQRNRRVVEGVSTAGS